MAMRILQEMCKKLELTLKKLIEVCPECKINASEYLQNLRQKKEAKEVWEKLCQSHLPLLDIESSIGKHTAISKKIKKYA